MADAHRTTFAEAVVSPATSRAVAAPTALAIAFAFIWVDETRVDAKEAASAGSGAAGATATRGFPSRNPGRIAIWAICNAPQMPAGGREGLVDPRTEACSTKIANRVALKWARHSA